jgi:DNA-binding MarR family transcriptional regulator
MSHSRIPKTFYLSLIKFMLQTKQELMTSSADFGLTVMQTFTLLLIDSEEPRSMNYFRKLYQCDASNITGIIDGLESKGLVARHEHPNDRRIKVIVFKPAGETLRSQLVEHIAEANAHILNELDDQEAMQLVGLIDKMTKPTVSCSQSSSSAAVPV